MRPSRIQPIAASILILSCAAYALTVLALHSAKTTNHPAITATASPAMTPAKVAISPSLPMTPTPVTPIWSDEFNGPAGQAPDPAHWNHDTGGDGWGNAEWEYYTKSTANAALDGNGHLVITARRPDRPAGPCATGPCDITSGRLTTDGTFTTTYGRIEARLQTPAGRGLWPAFWMVAADGSGELDIMENNGDRPGVISGSAHIYGYTPESGISAEFSLTGPSAAASFHTYAIDWSPQKIVWSVDGLAYHTVSKTDPAAAHWVFNRPFYLLLNLAVGSADPGYPDATTPFPAKLVVDYIRVYRQAQR